MAKELLARACARNRAKWVAALAMAATLLATGSQAAPAGYTPGSFAVSPSGAATYSIPISVPHGVRDMQPQLSLEYNSQSERGLAGIGWTLRGLSSITRCPRTKRQDGVRGSVTLAGTDRFCLDGQRLVLESAGTYGAVGAVYRTERDVFSRVTSYGTAGSGPAWFKVETKSGLTIELGNTPDSRIRPGPAAPSTTQPETALLWAINRVTDKNGNAMSFTYTTDPSIGSYVIQRIDYNSGNAWVEFDYTSISPRVSYIAGAKTTSKFLLSKIRSMVNASQPQRIKEYSLYYDNADIKGTLDPDDRLVSVIECGSDFSCLPSIGFAWNYWSTSQASFDPSTSTGMSTAFTETTGWTDEGVTPRRFVDANADGLPDIVGFAFDGVYVLLNTASGWPQTPVKAVTGFGNNQGFNDENVKPRRLIDMNGDGHPDIVGFSGGVWVSFWNQVSQSYSTPSLVSSEFDTSSDWHGPHGSGIGEGTCPRNLADMNGDGYPDIVGFCAQGVYVAYWNPATNTFSPKSLNLAAFGLSDSWLNEKSWPRRLVDMNGDGFPDIVGFGTSAIYVSFWNPISGTFNTPQSVLTSRFTSNTGWSNEDVNPRQLVDMNGDGYLDIVGFASDGAWVALWNGVRFEEPSRWTTSFSVAPWGNENVNPRQLADVNGDGFADIVGFGSDGIYVSLSNGRGAFTPPTLWRNELGSATADVFGTLWNNETKYPRRIEDSDGNGMPDIMAFGKDRVTFIQPSAPPGIRVTSITSSLGHKTDIQYTLAQSFSGFYTKDQISSAFPVAEQSVPMYLVSRVTQGDGIGGTQTSRYRYGGLKGHHDHGSLGFKWTAVRDEATGIESYSEVNQTFPFIGMPVKNETYRSSLAGTPCYTGPGELCKESFTVTKGTVLSRATYSLAQESLGAAGEYTSNQRLLTYVQESVESAWELNGDPLPIKTTRTELEEPRQVAGSKQWGNVTKVRVSFNDGHATETNNTYFPADETNWALGRLQRATVADTRPARTISVPVVADAAAPSSATPISPAVLSAILSLLLDD